MRTCGVCSGSIQVFIYWFKWLWSCWRDPFQMWWCNIVIGTQGLYPGLTIENTIQPVTGEFPTQMPVTRGFDVYFDLLLNKQLSKQSWGWCFEMPSCPLWCQCNILRDFWRRWIPTPVRFGYMYVKYECTDRTRLRDAISGVYRVTSGWRYQFGLKYPKRWSIGPAFYFTATAIIAHVVLTLNYLKSTISE